MVQMDAANGSIIGREFKSSKGYGTFFMSTTGRPVIISTLKGNVEMQSKGNKKKTTTTNKAVSSTIDFIIPTTQTKGRVQAFLEECLGDASKFSAGTIKTALVDVDQDGTSAQVVVTCKVEKVSWPNYEDWYGTNKAWTYISFGDIKNGEDLYCSFSVTKRAGNNNKFSNRWGQGQRWLSNDCHSI